MRPRRISGARVGFCLCKKELLRAHDAALLRASRRDQGNGLKRPTEVSNSCTRGCSGYMYRVCFARRCCHVAANPFAELLFALSCSTTRFTILTTLIAFTNMPLCQQQCSTLQRLADALAVDFAGARVHTQTQRLFKLAFPEAPAVR